MVTLRLDITDMTIDSEKAYNTHVKYDLPGIFRCHPTLVIYAETVRSIENENICH